MKSIFSLMLLLLCISCGTNQTSNNSVNNNETPLKITYQKMGDDIEFDEYAYDNKIGIFSNEYKEIVNGNAPANDYTSNKYNFDVLEYTRNNIGVIDDEIIMADIHLSEDRGATIEMVDYNVAMKGYKSIYKRTFNVAAFDAIYKKAQEFYRGYHKVSPSLSPGFVNHSTYRELYHGQKNWDINH